MEEKKDYEFYNKLIDQYVNLKETDRALILDGSWGTGKTYYVENVLKLTQKKKECISLYGVNSVEELTKIMFFSKFCHPQKKTKKKVLAKILIQMVKDPLLNYLSSKLPVDISKGISNKNLADFYQVVNYRKYLIILDDLERSSIDILELMGFINHLVEKNGIKILIVCDREKLVNNSKIINNEKFKDKYISVEEKTIYRIIKFNPKENSTIESVLKGKYFDESLYNYINEDSKFVEKIMEIPNEIKKDVLDILYNKFIYEDLNEVIDADKKIEDIKNQIEFKEGISLNFRDLISFCIDFKNAFILENDNEYYRNFNSNFLKYCFFSNLEYEIINKMGFLNLKDGEKEHILSKIDASKEFKNYSKTLILNKEKLLQENKNFLLTHDENASFAIESIENWYISKEDDLINGISFLNINFQYIPIKKYYDIMKELVSIKHHIFYDYDKVQVVINKLIISLEKNYDYDNVDLKNKLFNYHSSFEFTGEKNKKILDEFLTIHNLLKNNMPSEYSILKFDFDYDDSKQKLEEIYNKANKFLEKKQFMSLEDFKLDNFISFYKNAPAKVIVDIAKTFRSIYKPSSNFKPTYPFKADEKLLILLKEKSDKILKEEKDRVKRYCENIFLDLLNSIIDKIKKENLYDEDNKKKLNPKKKGD